MHFVIKIEKTEVFGWEASIRGLRNPMNSWEKSDSCIDVCDSCPVVDIGSNDLKLMKSLTKAGDDHAKFLRMINVTCDITAPLYWWKEFDTYKVGTVANSCSTMHKIHAKEFTLDDFSHEHLSDEWDDEHVCGYENSNSVVYYNHEYGNTPKDILEFLIEALNHYRNMFLETKDKKYWQYMIQLLPSSYNQKRTVQLNYQVLKSMYFARKGHRLDEWEILRQWVETLPYAKELICLSPHACQAKE